LPYAIAFIKTHAFQDGNKHAALLAVRAFLKANGMEFDYGPREEEAVEMMQDIATDCKTSPLIARHRH
jgi:prophage maintenance system killer protein